MTPAAAGRLITLWRERAAFYRTSARNMSQSKCNQPARELRRGMAAAFDMAADELEARMREASSNG
jgi:hypothetical protein